MFGRSLPLAVLMLSTLCAKPRRVTVGSPRPSVQTSVFTGNRRIRTFRVRRRAEAIERGQTGRLAGNCLSVRTEDSPLLVHARLENLPRNLPHLLSIVWPGRFDGWSGRWIRRRNLIHVPLWSGRVVVGRRQSAAASLPGAKIISRLGLLGPRRPAAPAKALPATIIQAVAIMRDGGTLSGAGHDRSAVNIVLSTGVQAHANVEFLNWSCQTGNIFSCHIFITPSLK